MKVLVIDDDADIRRIARFSLTRFARCEVLEANNGAEGIALARAERPDVILLDVTMPGADGRATLRALQVESTTAAIPVVFLTARAGMREESDDLMRLGARGVLAKPFKPNTLGAQLERLLGP